MTPLVHVRREEPDILQSVIRMHQCAGLLTHHRDVGTFRAHVGHEGH